MTDADDLQAQADLARTDWLDATARPVPPEKIAELRRLCDAATAGPWRHIPWHIAEGPSQVRVEAGWLLCELPSDADAAFIAAAREWLPRLLDIASQGEWRPSTDAPLGVKVEIAWVGGPVNIARRDVTGWYCIGQSTALVDPPTHFRALPAPTKDTQT